MEQKISTRSLPKTFRQALPQLFEPTLIGQIEQRFSELMTGSPKPANRQLQWHLFDYILPGLAVYQTLCAEGQEQATALANVDKLFELIAVPFRRPMKRLGRFPLIYPVLRLYIRMAMRQYPPEGWQTEWVENSADAIRFNMHSCFYFDTLSRYGAAELTASFCRNDDLVYDKMSPYLEWKRTQTIGRGATYCDFCFARATKDNQKDKGRK